VPVAAGDAHRHVSGAVEDIAAADRGETEAAVPITPV
jgi:hypothetical protein